MNLNLTEEQIAVRDAARDFAQNVLKPGVIERDRDQRFPADEIRQLGELGFMGMMVDPKYGGSGMDTVRYVLAMVFAKPLEPKVVVVCRSCCRLRGLSMRPVVYVYGDLLPSVVAVLYSRSSFTC